MKGTLLKYELPKYHAMNDNFTVVLTIEKTTFFGKKKVKKINYRLEKHDNMYDHFKHWDELINTKATIKI
ncbi:MAG: hypothetical protein LBQ68_02680 [Clostridiales bacterium]|jgi:hypothetical protein|nr:hypothetical protein [Clostridiales bacterium]